jgi:hypothetical protein
MWNCCPVSLLVMKASDKPGMNESKMSMAF